MLNWNGVLGNTNVSGLFQFELSLPFIVDRNKTTSTTTIKPLIRPTGEAGNRKRGFILYDAMEMSKVENGTILYDRMRVS
jgi:hypothetical protein